MTRTEMFIAACEKQANLYQEYRAAYNLYRDGRLSSPPSDRKERNAYHAMTSARSLLIAETDNPRLVYDLQARLRHDGRAV